MSQKPEALRLATILDSLGWRSVDSELREASAMLRNQHAEIERLRAELAESATDLSRVLETVKYLSGIAERGEGRKIGESETVEQFVLGYVKKLEAKIERLRAELEAVRKQEPVAWMNVRNGFICKKPTNADYQQPLYLAAGAQPAQSEWEVKIGEKLLPKARPAPSVLDIVDRMSEFATHDIERGEMTFDKWSLREAVEATIVEAQPAPSGLETRMYQDAEGKRPVTGVNQPVGLVRQS